MPRTKPTTKIDVIGNLDLRPEEAVGDNIESKQQEKYFVKVPDWDSAGDSVELIYLHNKREHDAMLKLQEELLEAAKREAAQNAHRIRKLNKTQQSLRKRFIDVNTFLKECDGKKLAAERKIAEEVAHINEHRELIESTKESIEELKEFREVLRATVAEYEPYQRVIEEVVQKSDIFDSVKGCMDRCDALMLAQVEISQLEHQKLQEIEQMRKLMVDTTNAAALKVLGLKNELTELERSYAKARGEVMKWERVLTNARNLLGDNHLNKERALDGIHLLYQLLCRRQGIEMKLQRVHVEQMLDFIKDEVELLRAVADVCEKRLEKDDKNKSKMASAPKC